MPIRPIRRLTVNYIKINRHTDQTAITDDAVLYAWNLWYIGCYPAHLIECVEAKYGKQNFAAIKVSNHPRIIIQRILHPEWFKY